MYHEDFGRHDRDGSGYIEKSELATLLARQVRRSLTEAEVACWMKAADADLDDKISLDEYLAIIFPNGFIVSEKGWHEWQSLRRVIDVSKLHH